MYKKIIKTFANILFFSIVGFIIIILATSRIPILGFRSYVVLTGSMEPKLPVGSVVFVHPSPLYKIGDIITFKRGNITITHRIKSMIRDMYQVKGDANKIADVELVSQNNIIGRDFVDVPYLGKFTNFLRSVPGFIIFIVIPTLIYVVLEGFVIKREWEKEIEKKVLKRLQISNSPTS